MRKTIMLALLLSTTCYASDYYYIGINQGLYRNSEDGRPWFQAGMGIKDIEMSLIYLGNDSHYESSRSKGIALSYLPKWDSAYARIGLIGYKNVWHTYLPPNYGVNYYREENKSGIAPLLGLGWEYKWVALELVYYTNVGRLAGSSDVGVITANVNLRF